MVVDKRTDDQDDHHQKRSLTSNQEMIFDLGITTDAFVDRLEELTGYSIDELLVQAICANYPELSPVFLSQPYFDNRDDISFWFHLGASDWEKLKTIQLNYAEKYTPQELVQKLLVVGWKVLKDGSGADIF